MDLSEKGQKCPCPERLPSRRAQSALEYFSAYSYGILVLAVIIAIVYAFFSLPQNIPQSQCIFPGYTSCKTLLFGTNGLATRVVLLFSNAQQYSIRNSSFAINVTGLGNYQGGCTPALAIPGGYVECVININNRLPSQLVTGSMTIYTSVCTQATYKGCGMPISQVYSGLFSTHASPALPNPQCTIYISAANSTQLANGVPDQLTSNVKIMSYGIGGGTVNFTANTINVGISPQYSESDSNGNAIAYASSLTHNTVGRITAAFENCTNSTTVTFK